jgi:5-methylthioadenosine/S-adenosylhomocysteine deaminase
MFRLETPMTSASQQRPLLIKHATVVTGDPSIGVVEDGDVLVLAGEISEIGPGLEHPEAETIDASGMIAMPGFIDTHRHTWEAPFRAVGADWTVGHYLTGIHAGVSQYFRPQDTYAAIMLGALDALDSGITTLLDWSHNIETPEHADASVQALFDSGMRAVFAHGGGYSMWQAPSSVPHTRDVVRVRNQYFPSDTGLVTLALAARGPEYSTMEVTEHDWALAKELDTRISVHLGAGDWGRNRPVARLYERGMMGPEITYVHCNVLAEDEFKMIADTGGTGSIAADVEIEMGMGFPATGRFMDAGVRPSLSIDVVVTTAGDMFGAMRTTLQLQRALDHQATPRTSEIERMRISTSDVFEFGTLQGARACGLEDITGTLTPGKKADLVLLNTRRLGLTPMNNPVGAIVQCACAGDVDSVFVEGRALKRDGRLLHVDADKIRREAITTRDYVIAAASKNPGLAGISLGGDWYPPLLVAPE